MSLSQLLKDHQQKQSDARRVNDRLLQDALTSTHTLTDTLTDHVNDGVSLLFAKQKELEGEAKALAEQTSVYQKQTKKWLVLVDDFNDALKELGDVKHWAQVMEQDMKAVMTTLEFVHDGQAR
ncbi:biogenesis of lysosome-related organelles complex 1 subunit 1 [Hesseltinella vesiculosa]|uniref:Biogenesis of lysosome-related organelles complex 1 subunit 1 n=1 Tax=Hesseltinella vesiculosa TaxID=101127 RepID=A0A1X2GX05_9FUNG|nr:biogenesis of lysosome-related organelles complex 1 subunit 1 [Hesseltinella vesiculosa]